MQGKALNTRAEANADEAQAVLASQAWVADLKKLHQPRRWLRQRQRQVVSTTHFSSSPYYAHVQKIARILIKALGEAIAVVASLVVTDVKKLHYPR